MHLLPPRQRVLLALRQVPHDVTHVQLTGDLRSQPRQQRVRWLCHAAAEGRPRSVARGVVRRHICIPVSGSSAACWAVTLRRSHPPMSRALLVLHACRFRSSDAASAQLADDDAPAAVQPAVLDSSVVAKLRCGSGAHLRARHRPQSAALSPSADATVCSASKHMLSGDKHAVRPGRARSTMYTRCKAAASLATAEAAAAVAATGAPPHAPLFTQLFASTACEAAHGSVRRGAPEANVSASTALPVFCQISSRARALFRRAAASPCVPQICKSTSRNSMRA